MHEENGTAEREDQKQICFVLFVHDNIDDVTTARQFYTQLERHTIFFVWRHQYQIPFAVEKLLTFTVLIVAELGQGDQWNRDFSLKPSGE
jgi:hypothetical protein